jgi:hypothetical protein
MAAKVQSKLSLIDIVTRADADVIRQALEARVKIDDLLVIREEAYKKILEIENEIEDVIGEEGAFDFGEAPYPVAGVAKKKPRPKPKAKTEGIVSEESSDSADSSVETASTEESTEDEESSEDTK